MVRNTARPSLKPYGIHPIHDFLRSAASKYPDKTAIIDGDSSYTFSGLENFSSKFSGAIKVETPPIDKHRC